MNTAMIFAAGRGERMRPLTDHTPKPLLKAGGKPLIVWQIEALARAGVQRIVINHAWLGEQFEQVLGDGSRWNVVIHYSPEGERGLETAGGIVQALPALVPKDQPHAVFLAVSGDVFCTFDFSTLAARAATMARSDTPGMHLVMVPNPDFHPNGDFALDHDGRLRLGSVEDAPRLTFGNIGLYDSRTFAELATHVPVRPVPLSPFFKEAIAAGRASGELWRGKWANVGTPAQLAALDQDLSATTA